MNKEVENFHNAIQWAWRMGYDFLGGKWEREDDGKKMSNKKLFEEFIKTKKYIK